MPVIVYVDHFHATRHTMDGGRLGPWTVRDECKIRLTMTVTLTGELISTSKTSSIQSASGKIRWGRVTDSGWSWGIFVHFFKAVQRTPT